MIRGCPSNFGASFFRYNIFEQDTAYNMNVTKVQHSVYPFHKSNNHFFFAKYF